MKGKHPGRRDASLPRPLLPLSPSGGEVLGPREAWHLCPFPAPALEALGA